VQPLFKRTLRKQFEADYGRLVERLAQVSAKSGRSRGMTGRG
jgi:hypothetical protein